MSDRITIESKSLEQLKKCSSIFDFAWNDSMRELTVIFNGKGVCFEDISADDLSPHSPSRTTNIHRVSIKIAEDFPQSPPEIRWLTPIIQPNVPFSGIIDLEEIGITWQPEMSLTMLCDRCWNLARLGYMNLDSASNQIAREWIENECTYNLPLDRRQLRNRSAASPQNIVSYRRKDETTNDRPSRYQKTNKDSAHGSVMYIDEENAAEEPMMILDDSPPEPNRKPPVATEIDALYGTPIPSKVAEVEFDDESNESFGLVEDLIPIDVEDLSTKNLKPLQTWEPFPSSADSEPTEQPANSKDDIAIHQPETSSDDVDQLIRNVANDSGSDDGSEPEITLSVPSIDELIADNPVKQEPVRAVESPTPEANSIVELSSADVPPVANMRRLAEQKNKEPNEFITVQNDEVIPPPKPFKAPEPQKSNQLSIDPPNISEADSFPDEDGIQFIG